MSAERTRQIAIERLARGRERGRAARLSGAELATLLGEELAGAVATLERHDRERGICASCGGRCCAELGCTLYRAEAPRCPIHAERPLLCRMHFCERFLCDHREAVVTLRDVYLAVLGDEPLGPPLSEEDP